jgi:hypothetical protein
VEVAMMTRQMFSVPSNGIAAAMPLGQHPHDLRLAPRPEGRTRRAGPALHLLHAVGHLAALDQQRLHRRVDPVEFDPQFGKAGPSGALFGPWPLFAVRFAPLLAARRGANGQGSPR